MSLLFCYIVAFPLLSSVGLQQFLLNIFPSIGKKEQIFYRSDQKDFKIKVDITATSMKMAVFCDVAPCSPVDTALSIVLL